MKRNLKTFLTELLLRRLWSMWRSGIEAAAVPGSGGIVFLGDSITHNARWDLMFPTAATRNFGISGERSDHLLARLSPIVGLKPEKLFLLIGTNDLSAGVGADEIGANVARILDQLRSALPGCELYLQTLTPRARNYAARVRALNALYASIAAQRGVTLIDLYSLFDNGSGEIRAEFTYDKLHLMGAAYSVWRDAIAGYVLAPVVRSAT